MSMCMSMSIWICIRICTCMVSARAQLAVPPIKVSQLAMFNLTAMRFSARPRGRPGAPSCSFHGMRFGDEAEKGRCMTTTFDLGFQGMLYSFRSRREIFGLDSLRSRRRRSGPGSIPQAQVFGMRPSMNQFWHSTGNWLELDTACRLGQCWTRHSRHGGTWGCSDE